MAKLTLEVDDEALPNIMEGLLKSGMIDNVDVVEVDDEDDDDEPKKPDEATAAVLAAIGGEGWKPPAEFFDDPQLDKPQRWTTVTSDGRVYGHAALFGECHIGYADKCLTPEMLSGAGLDYANNVGHVMTADGSSVGTGPIAIKGGHADTNWDHKRATSHYDDPSTVVADVVYRIDDHGINFSGALRPSATPEQVYSLRASGVSGDWRTIDGELKFLASCCVNLPGFPKIKARVASGQFAAVVAAGGDPMPDPELEHDCNCKEKKAEEPKEEPKDEATVETRIASLEKDVGFIRSYVEDQRLAQLSASFTDPSFASDADTEKIARVIADVVKKHERTL